MQMSHKDLWKFYMLSDWPSATISATNTAEKTYRWQVFPFDTLLAGLTHSELQRLVVAVDDAGRYVGANHLAFGFTKQ